MTGPLVSIITPTWQRHDLLLERCIPSVRAQTYRPVEHVVVSDGPDPALAELLADLRVVYGEVPFHNLHPHNWGSHARNHALGLVSGEVVAYLDDDNAFRPDHLTRLVAALEADPAADFAYSRMLRRTASYNPVAGPHTWASYEVGAAPPSYGQIDTSLLVHRRGLPERLGWWPPPGAANGGDPHAPDWGVVAQWLAGGARWVFVPEVTVDYYFAEAS